MKKYTPYQRDLSSFSLPYQRECLVGDAREATESAERAMMTDGGIGYLSRKATADKTLAAIATFDAAHPEIIAQIKATEAEARKEAMQNVWD